MLGLSAIGNSTNYRWQRVTPADEDYLPLSRRLVRVIQDRLRWKQALDEARRRAELRDTQLPPTGRAA
jgi:hypothetical protein